MIMAQQTALSVMAIPGPVHSFAAKSTVKFPGDTDWSQQGVGESEWSQQGVGDSEWSQQGVGSVSVAARES